MCSTESSVDLNKMLQSEMTSPFPFKAIDGAANSWVISVSHHLLALGRNIIELAKGNIVHTLSL